MTRAIIATVLLALGFVAGAARLDADEAGGIFSIAPATGDCAAFIAWGDGADEPATVALECSAD